MSPTLKSEFQDSQSYTEKPVLEKQGRKEARKEGRKEGRKKRRREGRREGRKEIKELVILKLLKKKSFTRESYQRFIINYSEISSPPPK